MKRKRKEVRIPPQIKGRWLPNDNTRAATFKDKKKDRSKKACRGKHANHDQE